MLVIFNPDEMERSWSTLRDFRPSFLIGLRNKFNKGGNNERLIRLVAERQEMIEARKQRNASLITSAKPVLERMSSLLGIPHFFMLTDQEGVVLHLHYPDKLVSNFDQVGLKEGVPFNVQSLGINSVSLAMEIQGTAIVRGEEHDAHLFHDWSCACVPIRKEDCIKGYLSLSYYQTFDITLAVPMVEKAAEEIERGLLSSCSERKANRVMRQFDTYGLTAREKEAAYGWLTNSSTLRIAADMGITEGTVRNMIKRVYAKTKIGDKGEFIRRFSIYL
ncbi:hypothetical protein PCCS19_50470 [Paenibacillus sp. CCS19]|nr:hypothetical protein PCCS19_50470 [Paenibacillus cellulosilyticus]